jgi:hypothetical protein
MSAQFHRTTAAHQSSPSHSGLHLSGYAARQAAKTSALEADFAARDLATAAKLKSIASPSGAEHEAEIGRIMAGGAPAAAKSGERPPSRLEKICERLGTLTDDLGRAAAQRNDFSADKLDLGQLVAQFQELATEVKAFAKPADRARSWRDRQPKRGHSRTHWVWASQGVKNNGGMDLNARSKLIARAKWWNLLRRAKGEHKGPLRGSGIEVYEALLFHFFNRKTGDCFPSLLTIAKWIGRSESVVAKAVQRLAVAKLLFIVPRRDRGIRRDGRKLPVVTSNAYVFPPITENNGGTAVRASQPWPVCRDDAASPLSGDLRSPAATALSRILLPPEVEPPF